EAKSELENIEYIEIIHNTLKMDGIASELLKNIVKNLQESINEMVNYIGYEKIYIEMVENKSNKIKKYDIVIKTDNMSDISNAGGFQSNILELLFKIAFLKINVYFKNKFIIIDEIFDACSEENRKVAIKLVEFFKMNYKKMLIVSHNPVIISLFD